MTLAVVVKDRRRPVLRRGPWENASAIVIGLGILLQVQPFALELYTWSFVTTLAGVAMFTIVSKFPV